MSVIQVAASQFATLALATVTALVQSNVRSFQVLNRRDAAELRARSQFSQPHDRAL